MEHECVCKCWKAGEVEELEKCTGDGPAVNPKRGGSKKKKKKRNNEIGVKKKKKSVDALMGKNADEMRG